jgi:type I restriction enzyme S subunit
VTWPVASLSSIAEVKLGRQRSPQNHSGPSMRKYLRAANVGWRGLILNDVKSMNFTDSEMATFRLEPGDLLLNEASGSPGEVGKPALWCGEIDDCAFQNTLLRVRTSDEVDSRYLLHFFGQQAATGSFARGSRGVGIHHLGREALSQWPIPLPPLAEQRRIAAILDQADALGGKNRHALDQINVLATSLFVHMFGDPVRNDMNWPAGLLGDYAERVTDGEHKTPRRTESGVPLLSARSVQSGWVDFQATDFVSNEEYEKLSRRIEPRLGDILISCSGTIGRVAQVRDLTRFAMVRSVALVRPRPDVSSGFLQQLLSTPSLNALMNVRANSSA